MSLPKVLIIGQPFNNNFGGGITQANLFGSWDKDKIAVVCTSHMLDNLNLEICDTYYQLGKDENKWIFPFNLLQRSVQSGVVKFTENNNPKSSVISREKLRTRIINDYFYPFLEYIGIFHSMSKIKISPKLCQWIDEYKPDVIYAQASTRETILFDSEMAAYIKKPMVFHMMDDWPSTISQRGPFKKFWHNKIDREFRLLLNKATTLLSISDGMAEEYKIRYAKDFITFHNPIETGFWKSHQRQSYKLSNTPTVLYAGRIGTGIQTSLESMALAIDKVNVELNTAIQFVLQTSDKPSWLENYTCVRHKALVPYGELPKVFAEADFLFLPYDFSEESIKFIKYSMPTKAPEFMVSGTPIIMFAPAETALVKHAINGKWAKVLTENNIDKLAAAVKQLVTDENERKQIALTAVEIAETKFNSTTVRNRFKEVIVSNTKMGAGQFA
jgi:glycosyltransferase involved in cell wall biosynthesis